MLRTIAARLGIFALSLVAASALIFLVTNALPGDVAQVLLGEGATPEQLAAKRAELGTDRPLPLQYLAWVAGMLQGDFGRSWLSGQSVAGLIVPKLAVTAWLALFGLGLAIALALPAGMLAALKRRRWEGFVVSGAAQVGMAIPAFWAGILLVLVFSVALRWLPANGYVPLLNNPVEWARHLVLPVVSLGLVQAAVLVRYVRSAFVEVLGEDYYRTARAVGWTRTGALLRHGIRNAALSLVTVLGLQLAAVLVGAIVIEQVFVLPGLGSLLLGAVASHDLIVIQGIVMLLVLAVLVINVLVNLSYVVIDPRLTSGDER